MAKPDQAVRRAKRAAAFQRRLTRGAIKHAKKTQRALERAHIKALEADQKEHAS